MGLEAQALQLVQILLPGRVDVDLGLAAGAVEVHGDMGSDRYRFLACWSGNNALPRTLSLETSPNVRES